MFGNNPQRAPQKGNGEVLQVKEIFPTLQGEGPYAGWSAIFVRMGGCNLTCDFCDTDFEDFDEWHKDSILDEVAKFSINEENQIVRRLVVITGGEPLLQPIAPLCDDLLERGFKVQIETNGTLWRGLDKRVEVICSPKNTHGVYAMLRDDLLQHITALKFIVSTYRENYKNVMEVGQSAYNIPVYVQPMDEQDQQKNLDNLFYATDLAQKHGYRLSVQLHKILGIR